jgi:UDP-N-acetyl-D-galactosamine dehydrogenase
MRKIIPGIVGLGYVGLPIFTRLQNKFKTIGFDINKKRISTLNKGFDINLEFSSKNLKKKNNSFFTNQIKDLSQCNFFIVTVPTPVLINKKPNLKPLILATRFLSEVIKKGDVIFYESTVYPGVTNKMILLLENITNLNSGKDFWVGYSPERVNPGDKNKTIDKISKIVAFENFPINIKERALQVYKAVTPKLVLSDSLKEAETSKVIENIQRDINIAFMNEILMICEKLKINFYNVIKLAKTKWNFLDFRPGLVGGHCLPVDPYYFHDLAKLHNFDSKLILAGRNVNNEMENFVYKSIIKKINFFNCKKILIAGVTYKANVADIRNSLALNIYKRLKKNKNFNTYCFDPIINNKFAKKYKILDKLNYKINFDLIVPLVSHTKLLKDLNLYKNSNTIFFDIFDFYKE